MLSPCFSTSRKTVRTNLTILYIHFGILFLGQMEILRKYLSVDDTRIDEPTSVQKSVTDNGPPAALAEMG